MGGHCPVKWEVVCMPKIHGWLDLICLNGMSPAMKLRHSWLARTAPDIPCRHLGCP